MLAFPTRATTSFEEKLNQRLVDTSFTMQVLAEQAGIPEPELCALCQLSDPRLSELERLAQALRVQPTPTYFLNGSFNQAGSGNTQKIKIGKAAAHKLAAQLGVCRQALEACEQLIAAKDVVIASKDETISLLRSRYTRISLLCPTQYALLFTSYLITTTAARRWPSA